jgi:ribonuclease HII
VRKQRKRKRLQKLKRQNQPKQRKKPPRKDFEALEADYSARGFVVAGADEAGRGAYAGPLAVGFVVFSPEVLTRIPSELKEVNDSKQLSAADRLRLATVIRAHAQFCCVVHVSNRKIDRMGINPSTEFALLRALRRAEIAGIPVSAILMDGRFRFERLQKKVKVETLVQGDSRVLSIAAASILAKTSRDARMDRFGSIFPQYSLADHKGYGTKAHRDEIKRNGVTRLHRQSYGIIEQPMLDFGDQ